MTVKISSSDTQTTERDAEIAVELAGFGKFNIKVVIICGLIFMNTGFSISSVGLVLPSAACDFNLTTIDKGRISAAPMLGMFVGSYFWGCLADVEGRKITLLMALFSHGVIELISSVIPYFWGYLVLKFFSGLVINGQSSVLFTYLGEFQSAEKREKILCWMEMAWSIGLIALPLVGWAVIPLNINLVVNTFFFRSWNLFVAICSIPSFMIGFWLLTFPETPKYLAEVGRDTKFSRALEKMYSENTGNSFEQYLEKVSKSGCESLEMRLKSVQSATKEGRRITRTNQSVALARNIYSQSLALIKPPYLLKTSITCSIMFSMASSYYALMLWFPELFQRFSRFEQNFPEESTSVCKVSQFKPAITNVTVSQSVECTANISTEVYVHTLILGVACVPLSMILPLFVNKLGYKFYLVISSLIASGATIGLFFVNNSSQNLILSCIFEAFSSVGLSIVLCMVVDLYPTNLRSMAAALCSAFARLGALIGNSLFGYLIDDNCIALIIMIAAQLAACAVLGLLVPLKRKTTKKLKSTVPS